MSDRGSNQSELVSLFKMLRDTVLPSSSLGWQNRTAKGRNALKNVGELYCGLRVVSNLTELMEKILNGYLRMIDPNF